MQTILTPHAPKPGGHYSQAVEHNGLIYISGQLPINPKNNSLSSGAIAEQCGQVLKNIQAILEAANSGFSHVLKFTIYISDMALWDQVNAVYADYLGAHQPARAVVPVGPLHHGALVEMDCVAVAKSTPDEYFYFRTDRISEKDK
ncbi:RidA family protein [candidate division KSB1 bacterium]|nr:RidA family protein [candidate division KSB1 bacterium]